MVRGERVLVLFLAGFLLISYLVYAQTSSAVTSFDISKSYDWLEDRLSNTTTPDVSQRSLATIALLTQDNPSHVTGLIEEVRKLENENLHCWPSTGACNVKDTALATLALSLAGQDVTEEISWLKNARVAGLTGGEWWIVIKADSDGSCTFTFPGGEKTFNLQEDRIRGPTGSFTAGQYHIKLNELSPTLVGTNSPVQPQITVNCDASLLNPIITLIFKPNVNTFFIQRSDAGSNLELRVANACFRDTASAGGCTYDSTAYATWALVEIGLITSDQELSLDNLGTHIFLESKALDRRDEPIALGLLNKILIKASNAAPSFITDLANLQRTDGGWGDVISTAIASFGLTGSDQGEAVARGIDYLTNKVRDDGSWNGDMIATSWALLVYGGELSRFSVPNVDISTADVEICGNEIDDDQDGFDDCGELECSSDPSCQCQNNFEDIGEEGVDCGGNCEVSCPIEDECVSDIDCLSSEICLNGACVLEIEEDEEEDEGGVIEPEEEKSLWWLWLILILVILGGGVFFYVKYIKTGKVKFSELFKKKPKGPTFEQYRREAEFRQPPPQRPVSRPAAPVRPVSRPQPGVRPKSDDELEKSLKEAEKLLKG